MLYIIECKINCCTLSCIALLNKLSLRTWTIICLNFRKYNTTLELALYRYENT